MKKAETNIQDAIRIALCANGCIVHRKNVGLFYTPDGRPVRIGVVGESDLYGHRESDGRVFYIETKTPIGKASDEQKRFIKSMLATNAIAGFARSVEDALKLVGG